jgi:hypothetical protein
MKSYTYIGVRTILRLEEWEQWLTHTKDKRKFPFYVQTIQWTGGDTVDLSGPALTKAGERGLINRQEHFFKFEDLNVNYQRELKLSRSQAINDLVREESQR